MRATFSLSTAEISQSFRRLVRPWLPWGSALLVVLCILQAQDSVSQGLALAGLVVPVLVATELWCQRGGPCLPVLPIVLAASLVIFGLPLVQFSNADLPDALLDLMGPSLFLWPSMLVLGWLLVPSSWLRRPPLPSLLGLGAAEQLLPHVMLAAAMFVAWLIQFGGFWSFVGPSLFDILRNPLNTLAVLLTLPAGFIGAYRWSRGQLKQPALYWLVVITFFFFYILSFLLSSAQNLVFSVLLGLWVGRSPKALYITLSLVALVAFLHLGKAQMRSKYWFTGVPKPSPPELILEWAGESINQIMLPTSGGQGDNDLGKRVQSLGMLMYVNLKLQSGTPPLLGQTYALIPRVIVPRFLNPDKVRSQEGQVVLNLHFGRQQTREQTERTYIAWGLLPEAVGNFGPLWGPVIVGIAYGALIRFSELVGAGQDLLSKAGLQSLVTAVLLAASYETVSTTLMASLFQIILLIELLSLVFQVRQ